MATCLSMLTSLETLQLEFEHHLYFPKLRRLRPFPPTRSVLPTLAIFRFTGVYIYLEEFVARIDAPQLYRLSTTFSLDFSFRAAELYQFISRTPTLGSYYDEAHLSFDSRNALVRLCQSHAESSDHRMVELETLCQKPDRQFSSMVQTCTSYKSLRLLLTMENLYIDGDLKPTFDDINNTKWLDLILPFTAVKNLYLSKLVSPRILRVLKELAEGSTTEVFPSLQYVLLEGFPPSRLVQRCISRFNSARRLLSRRAP